MIEVRHGRHDGQGPTTSSTFDCFAEAKDFADWIREDWDMDVYWVEFDDIGAFAQEVEQVAKASAAVVSNMETPRRTLLDQYADADKYGHGGWAA